MLLRDATLFCAERKSTQSLCPLSSAVLLIVRAVFLKMGRFSFLNDKILSRTTFPVPE